MSRKLYGSLALTKMKCQTIVTKQGTECLAMPIDGNFLVRGANGAVYLNTTLWINDEVDQYGNIASIKHTGQIEGKKWADLTEEEKKTINDLLYLGNFKEATSAGGNDAAGIVSADPIKEDDLPW